MFSDCLLISDFDGTIMYNGTIPENNIEAVKYFIDNGGKFGLATGRHINTIKPYFDVLSCNVPIIAFNGAAIYDYTTNKTLNIEPLNKSVKANFKSLQNAFPNIGIAVHCLNAIYVLNHTKSMDEHLEYVGSPCNLASVEDIADKDWLKIIFLIKDKKSRNKIKAFAKDLEMNDCVFTSSHETIYEMLPKNANKGEALIKLAELLSITRENIFSIGDFHNDIELIRSAGCGATVGDAPDEIKQIADYIACPCKDGALQDFIGHIKLLKIVNQS